MSVLGLSGPSMAVDLLAGSIKNRSLEFVLRRLFALQPEFFSHILN